MRQPSRSTEGIFGKRALLVVKDDEISSIRLFEVNPVLIIINYNRTLSQARSTKIGLIDSIGASDVLELLSFIENIRTIFGPKLSGLNFESAMNHSL